APRPRSARTRTGTGERSGRARDVRRARNAPSALLRRSRSTVQPGTVEQYENDRTRDGSQGSRAGRRGAPWWADVSGVTPPATPDGSPRQERRPVTPRRVRLPQGRCYAKRPPERGGLSFQGRIESTA